MKPKITVDGEDLTDEAGWRKLRAQYFGLVKIIDDAVRHGIRSRADRSAREHDFGGHLRGDSMDRPIAISAIRRSETGDTAPLPNT